MKREGLIDVRRAAERFKTRLDWLDSNHCFSFGEHYDPENTGHGLLLVSNDDVVRAGSGFQTHPHEDMEIVTWVLEGELEHKDSTGKKGIIVPGLAQRMSAGTGIWHSEMNPSRSKDVRLVQMWVRPDTGSVDPSYEQLDISSELAKGGLVPVASGNGRHSAIRIQQKDATLWAARLAPGASVKVPDARTAHVYVARGAVDLEGAGLLEEGDAARLVAAGTPKLTAYGRGAEILIWEMKQDPK